MNPPEASFVAFERSPSASCNFCPTRPFAISLNSVSKHIRMLERAALVRRRVEGRDHVIALNPGGLDEAAQWIEAQRGLWAWRLGELDKALKEQTDG